MRTLYTHVVICVIICCRPCISDTTCHFCAWYIGLLLFYYYYDNCCCYYYCYCYCCQFW